MTDVDLVAAVDAVVRPATAEDRAHAHRRLLDAGGEAVPALLRALAEGLAAEPIIETLGLLGDLRAVSPLRRMLRRSDADVACAAAKAPAISPTVPPCGRYEMASPRLTSGYASRRC